MKIINRALAHDSAQACALLLIGAALCAIAEQLCKLTGA